MNKNIWIIANWKSNKTIPEALEWINHVGPKLPKIENIKIVVCPTFSALSEVKKAISAGNYNLLIGAQNVSPYEMGAYTGEEPGEALAQFADLVIIGHSERRTHFAETDEEVEKKVKMALSNKMSPLVCIQGSDTPVPSECRMVAYEPVFAIGTGTPDTPENAQKLAVDVKTKTGVNVLYGGSVDSANVRSFLKMADINGVLVGRASLSAEEFIKIIEEANLEADKT